MFQGLPPSPPLTSMAGLTVRWACRHQAIATAGQGVDMGITTARMGKTDHGALRSRGWCDFDYLCFCHVLSRMIDTGWLCIKIWDGHDILLGQTLFTAWNERFFSTERWRRRRRSKWQIFSTQWRRALLILVALYSSREKRWQRIAPPEVSHDIAT